VCAQPVVKDIVAGRRVYYCPSCQSVGPENRRL
jgi:formamidopyrimidine-DNA glycosylase